MNRVILIGYVSSKPELVTFKDGNKLAKFSLATSKRWLDKETKEKKEKTEWHSVISINTNQAEVLEKWLDKGSRIMIEGEIVYKTYLNKDNIKMNKTDIKCITFEFLGGSVVSE